MTLDADSSTADHDTALESGAFPSDIKPEDFDTPGGTTDPLWYYVADELAPKDQGHNFREGWIEGFVLALELVRGKNLRDSSQRSVAPAIRSTVD